MARAATGHGRGGVAVTGGNWGGNWGTGGGSLFIYIVENCIKKAVENWHRVPKNTLDQGVNVRYILHFEAFIFDLSDFTLFCTVENSMWKTRETIAITGVAGVKQL